MFPFLSTDDRAAARTHFKESNQQKNSLSTVDLAMGAKAVAEPMRAARITADFMVVAFGCRFGDYDCG